jgi:hypothetical protein
MTSLIPSNISREHILTALREIDSAGVPHGRESTRFTLVYESKPYPPKYVISLANKFANGRALRPSDFNGGTETNGYLDKLGFYIEGVSFQNRDSRILRSRDQRQRPVRRTHSERCQDCKKRVETLLGTLYGRVETNYKFALGVKPQDYNNHKYYSYLAEIYAALAANRGFQDFVRAPSLPNVDFFVPKPGFIVEFDESQHFTLPRKLALNHYPRDLQLGFSLQQWIYLSETIAAEDDDPPFRDEQRAWYDALRDFVPAFEGLQPTVRLYASELQWCALDGETPDALKCFEDVIEKKRHRPENWVATVVMQSDGSYTNYERLDALHKIVRALARDVAAGVLVFPGGWFSAGDRPASELYPWVGENVSKILAQLNEEILVCVGLDGRVEQHARDQIGLGISKNGIIAAARKFHPAPPEIGHVDLARDHLVAESGKPRILEFKGKTFFFCACYDSFGIKHKNIANPGVDVVVDLVHRFQPKGFGNSGDVYFAKHGFAGASKEWNCLVVGATAFFQREIPIAWPSAVYWNQGAKSTQEWSYADNPVVAHLEFRLKLKEGLALVRVFDLDLLAKNRR